jgi:hypothetical protein
MKYRPSHLTLTQFHASYSSQVAELLKVRTGKDWRSVPVVVEVEVQGHVVVDV